MANTFIPEGLRLVRCLEAATDAAGRTGDWIRVTNAQRAYVSFTVTQGAANTILVSVLQATAAAGTGSKVLTNNVPIWLVDDANTTDVEVKQTAAKNLTTSAGTTHKRVIFEIEPSAALDMANGFNWITVSTGASSASNLTHCDILLCDLRYANPTQTTAIA